MDLLENPLIAQNKGSMDSLPKGVQDAASSVSGFVSNKADSVKNFFSAGTSNFSLASLPQKVGEGAQKLLGSFGSLSPFKNMTNGLPTGALANQLTQNGLSIGKGQTLSGGQSTTAPRENLDDIVILLESTISEEYVRFSVSPRVSESRQANYHEINITHHPGTILKYEKTSSRSWTISAKFVSRTQEEASNNQRDLNIIRAWVMPFYGSGTEKNDSSMLGAPPAVLKLSGYGERNIAPIPVVLESYSTSWPNDIDYLPTNSGDPVPVIMEIELTLKESYSPAEYSNFNLFAYKSGDVSKAFTGSRYTRMPSKIGNSNGVADTSEPTILGKIPAMSGKIPTASDLAGAVAGKAGGGLSDLMGKVKDIGNKIGAGISGLKMPTSIGTALSSGDAQKSFEQFQKSGSNSA